MSIKCAGDAVLMEGVCPVEDAETLLHLLQAGASHVDWTGCTHLHASCLQVLLVAGLPVRGLPANAALARWVEPLFAAAGTAAPPSPAHTTHVKGDR
jgi:hypothetical protein